MSSAAESPPPKGPVYEGIKQRLRAQVTSGDLPEGARVPSEHALGRLFQRKA